MARFNALIALVAGLLFLSAVGAKTSSAPRRALKQNGDGKPKFKFDLDDLKGDFNFGGDKNGLGEHFEDYKGNLNFGKNKGASLLGGGNGKKSIFDELFSSKDGFEFNDLHGDKNKFTGEIRGAFSGFHDKIESIVARYKSDP